MHRFVHLAGPAPEPPVEQALRSAWRLLAELPVVAWCLHDARSALRLTVDPVSPGPALQALLAGPVDAAWVAVCNHPLEADTIKVLRRRASPIHALAAPAFSPGSQVLLRRLKHLCRVRTPPHAAGAGAVVSARRVLGGVAPSDELMAALDLAHRIRHLFSRELLVHHSNATETGGLSIEPIYASRADSWALSGILSSPSPPPSVLTCGPGVHDDMLRLAAAKGVRVVLAAQAVNIPGSMLRLADTLGIAVLAPVPPVE